MGPNRPKFDFARILTDLNRVPQFAPRGLKIESKLNRACPILSKIEISKFSIFAAKNFRFGESIDKLTRRELQKFLVRAKPENAHQNPKVGPWSRPILRTLSKWPTSHFWAPFWLKWSPVVWSLVDPEKFQKYSWRAVFLNSEIQKCLLKIRKKHPALFSRKSAKFSENFLIFRKLRLK